MLAIEQSKTRRSHEPAAKGLNMETDRYRRITPVYARVFDRLNEPLHALIRNKYPAPPGSRVLDIGCGTGAQLAGYLGEDRELFGVDLSPSMLDRARQRLGADAHLHLGSAADLPFDDGFFDQVLASMVLHEMPRDTRLAVIGEIRRVLRTDGRLLVVEFTPAPATTSGRIFRAISWPIERLAGAEHFREFRRFVDMGGFPAVAEVGGMEIESSRMLAGGNTAVYIAS